MIKSSFKKIVFLSVVLAVAVVCTTVYRVSQATVVITAPDGFAAGCATGFSRAIPHMCLADAIDFDGQSATLDNTCRVTSFTVIPASAVAVILRNTITITSNNTVSNKIFNFGVYGDSGCTTQTDNVGTTIREFVAVTTNTNLLVMRQILLAVPLVSGQVRYVGSGTNTGSSTANFLSIAGYYD